MMSDLVSFDVRVANYIVKRLDRYIIGKRRRKEIEAKESWLKLFHNKDHFVHQLGNGVSVNLYKDSVLSKLIYEHFETAEIDFLNNFVREGDIFVDIGANIGLFSLYASRKVGPGGSVIAFEPASTTYGRFVENIQLNGFGNIRPYKLGLSDKDEILELNISSNGYEAWNTFVQTTDDKFSVKERVQVKSFDHFLKENAVDASRISLIKLDVEGFEMNVLRGSVELLTNPDAPVFMIEFTDDNAISAGNCCHELFKFLLQYNYSWYTYNESAKKLTPEPMRLNYPYNNLIAVKNAVGNKRIAGFI